MRFVQATFGLVNENTVVVSVIIEIMFRYRCILNGERGGGGTRPDGSLHRTGRLLTTAAVTTCCLGCRSPAQCAPVAREAAHAVRVPIEFFALGPCIVDRTSGL